MCEIAIFTFNPFQENTYVLFDETKECIIIDPGCYTAPERQQLQSFITERGLKPVRLINTHSHIDHILGNWFVAEEYNLKLEMHRDEVAGLVAAPEYGKIYGIQMQASPEATVFLTEADTITFGNTSLSILLTPGHSIASLSFYCEAGNFVIGGDVLFKGSIGRTDLPNGDFDTLINSIKTKLFTLADDVQVFPGHGDSTTIGEEKATNPFLKD
jgi:glyoxylase-like metal-dependent hydrolase (beta-lactamase superfamily II)